jgi:hypothetical protein
MSSNYTPNLGLKKPVYRDPDTFNAWDVVVNTNMDTVDSAFGNRNYTEQNYITNSDTHTASINKLDMGLKDASDLAPTQAEKDALTASLPDLPSGANKYVTQDYIRFARKEVLYPEFQSATFKVSGSTTNTGTLSTNAETHSDFVYNYYKWVSTEAAFQDYDISVQWRVPETFESWHATKALIIDLCTKEGATTNCKAKVILSIDGSVAAPTDSGEIAGTSGDDWCSEREANQVIVFPATDLTLDNLVIGDTLNIIIRMYSKENGTSDGYVKIGAITFQYTG